MNTPTAAGPRLNFPLPRRQSVAVGSVKVGPTPQMKRLGRDGAKNRVGLMSPSPNALPDTRSGPSNSEGWFTMGTIVRTMTFQSWPSLIGTTGCTFRT
jgi:hypothetical protein